MTPGLLWPIPDGYLTQAFGNCNKIFLYHNLAQVVAQNGHWQPDLRLPRPPMLSLDYLRRLATSSAIEHRISNIMTTPA